MYYVDTKLFGVGQKISPTFERKLDENMLLTRYVIVIIELHAWQI